MRFAVKPTTGSSASFPELGDPAISQAGNLPLAGGLRTYQAWYRDPANPCSSSGFNFTNGLRVLWTY